MQNIAKTPGQTKALSTFILFLGLALLGGCQLAPTKVSSHREFTPSDLEKKSAQPLQVEGSVLIDARSAFEYNLAHVPGSYNMQWEDFAQTWSTTPGLLKPETQKLCDRLALFGINPASHVIVIGHGLQGAGEEGRLAWTLYYLGVSDVQFVAIEHFHSQLTQQDSDPAKNAPYWKPQLHSDVLVDYKEFYRQLAEASKSKARSIRVIDVRTPAEYLKNSPNIELGAFNIDWHEFLTKDGRPRFKIASQLTASGIHKDDPIFVISNRGVRSAMVTMVLRMMGFSRAANFAGGYTELALHPVDESPKTQ